MRELAEQLAHTLPFENCGILSSADRQERYDGSSGGVVTAIARELFKQGRISSAVCFEFSGPSLFEPRLIFNSNDYIQTGSIYHQVPLVQFLRDNLKLIRAPLFVTCLPCQITAIRRLLSRSNIECVLVSLVCSGQMNKQATYDFLRVHGIDIEQVKHFCYRGKGWPSGIQVEMQDGQKHFFHNLQSDWKTFFHSTIYNLDRCFHCTDSHGRDADFMVADPWLKEFIEHETQGCTVVAARPHWAGLLDEMLQKRLLEFHKELSLADFVESQYWTVAKKESFRRFASLRFLIHLFRTPLYRRLFLTGRYRYFHYKRYMKILNRYKRKLYAQSRDC